MPAALSSPAGSSDLTESVGSVPGELQRAGLGLGQLMSMNAAWVTWMRQTVFSPPQRELSEEERELIVVRGRARCRVGGRGHRIRVQGRREEA